MELLNNIAIHWINEKGTDSNEEVGVFQMTDGKYVVAQSSNIWRVATALNSPEFNELYPSRSVARVVGMKPVTSERTLDSVTEKFKGKYGAERIYCVAA